VVTAGTGSIDDADLFGALTTIRANTINVLFDTGSANNTTALRIDAKGLTGGSAADATFRFNTLRPITFDALWADRATVANKTALTITDLLTRDWIVIGATGTVALKGLGTPPAATRTVNTGALTNVRLTSTPGAGSAAPTVTINGVVK